MKAFDEVNRLWDTVEKLCQEELENNEGDIRIAILDHMLVPIIYLKDNFNNVRNSTQNIEDRIRCYQNCCRVFNN